MTGSCQPLQPHFFPLTPHSLDSNHTHLAHFCPRTFALMVPSSRSTLSINIHISLLLNITSSKATLVIQAKATPSPCYTIPFYHLHILYLWPKLSYLLVCMFIFYLPSTRIELRKGRNGISFMSVPLLEQWLAHSGHSYFFC